LARKHDDCRFHERAKSINQNPLGLEMNYEVEKLTPQEIEEMKALENQLNGLKNLKWRKYKKEITPGID